jgi:hypothetical protein
MSNTKQQYVKITRPDKSVHFAPLSAKSKLVFQNTLKKDNEKLRLEEVELTDKELAEHPKFDENFVPAAGDNKVASLKKQAESAAARAKELEDENEELKKALGAIPQAKAADVIAMIMKAESIEEVDELVGDDTRVTVTKAANEKKESLKGA